MDHHGRRVLRQAGLRGAYESLTVRTYPLTDAVAVTPEPDWREVRHLKTVLGTHLLVRTDAGWQQMDPATMQERVAPTADEVRALVEDALTANPTRYGAIAAADSTTITTDTGVRVTVDWDRLALSQRGLDTDRIDGIYRIHYLQWTGIAWLDRIVGAVGLVLVLGLSFAGVWLLTRRRRLREGE
mgnify:CR=1 FL=1